MEQVMEYPKARIVIDDEARRRASRSKYAAWANDVFLRLERTYSNEAVAYEFDSERHARSSQRGLRGFLRWRYDTGLLRTRRSGKVIYFTRGPKWSERFHWTDES